MSVGHYENFPVGSWALPRRLRRPVHAVYAFARHADDLADEGDAPAAERLAALNALKEELDRMAAGQEPQTALMRRLHDEAVAPFALPLQPFYDLLSAFMQDVEKTRYQNFAELADYCRRSANPVGRIMLHLYGESDSRSVAQSDGICTARRLAERPRLHSAGRHGQIQSQRRTDCRRTRRFRLPAADGLPVRTRL